MGTLSLKKKLKMVAGDRFEKKKKNKGKGEEDLDKTIGEKKKNKALEKRRKQESSGQNDAKEVVKDEEKNRTKLQKKKKIKNSKIIEVANGNVDENHNEVEDEYDKENGANEAGGREKSKLKKERKINKKTRKAGDRKMNAVDHETQGLIENPDRPNGADTNINLTARKSKRTRKIKRTDQSLFEREDNILDKQGNDEQEEVYEMSSEDETSASGMKKWIMAYHQRRPGLKILQQRIDDFITDYEAKQEKERKEKEAQAEEGGWTVVVHHKGRKKTTDYESGIAVGSVAQAAILDKVAKKKSKEVGLEFYRFQKREAHKNEIMMLQSKFEQDKKRIQQMRAARKFRPY